MRADSFIDACSATPPPCNEARGDLCWTGPRTGLKASLWATGRRLVEPRSQVFWIEKTYHMTFMGWGGPEDVVAQVKGGVHAEDVTTVDLPVPSHAGPPRPGPSPSMSLEMASAGAPHYLVFLSDRTDMGEGGGVGDRLGRHERYEPS